MKIRRIAQKRHYIKQDSAHTFPLFQLFLHIAATQPRALATVQIGMMYHSAIEYNVT